MALPKTITSANAKFTLTVLPILPVPFLLQGYSADSAFLIDSMQAAEAVMGVDGKLSAGFVPAPTPVNIKLMPDSPSIEIFENWLAAEKAAKELFWAYATIALPSLGKSYVCSKGALTAITQAPPAGKVLQAQDFTILFEDVQAVPLVLA